MKPKTIEKCKTCNGTGLEEKNAGKFCAVCDGRGAFVDGTRQGRNIGKEYIELDITNQVCSYIVGHEHSNGGLEFIGTFKELCTMLSKTTWTIKSSERVCDCPLCGHLAGVSDIESFGMCLRCDKLKCDIEIERLQEKINDENYVD